mmetsp:Transcript_117082/g.227651  ORF Transcript_117082/g.227651 Transcript_117082/m.227651 type:complete len:101 (+) Transcript_117082:680-982(+)
MHSLFLGCFRNVMRYARAVTARNASAVAFRKDPYLGLGIQHVTPLARGSHRHRKLYSSQCISPFPSFDRNQQWLLQCPCAFKLSVRLPVLGMLGCWHEPP